MDFTEHARSLRLMCTALLLGYSLFAVISVVIGVYGPKEFSADIMVNNLFLIMASGMMVVCVPVGIFVYRKGIAQMKQVSDPNQKFLKHRTAYITAFAIFEAIGMFGCVTIIITGNLYILIVLIMCALSMLIHFPTERKLKEELEMY